ncbi:hypothetical protein BBO_08060 [Beauveria brongniartii RCEF 3172]|uniref:Uncharacterized protein n=1 Tax=Beauveria brongniartii RCEF 3172 TaxID=1081107 RepID=A0A166YDC9_9HYPO|nr:hypothetical protein BBO_08060 [Beauveria brongniartii RCEF 3172]
MATKRKYDVYVAVFVGTPLDFCKYRHVGLWYEPEDNDALFYAHVTGVEGEFKIEKRWNYDPAGSRTFAKKVKVGTTKRSLTHSELVALSESVSVDNDNPEFNCQHWVEHGLLVLLEKGLITEKEYNDGLNGMIDATMEAEDEDLA